MPPVAAADNGKSSTHKNSSSNGKGQNTKLCHIVKRSDFDGYGFNLHSEKSKPGQYIGKIDANSPAEAAGLKEGDRIIEVNGLPIGNETHKQVVQRIKAIAWEVKLLVINDGGAPVIPVTTVTTTTSTSTSTTPKTPESANKSLNNSVNMKSNNNPNETKIIVDTHAPNSLATETTTIMTTTSTAATVAATAATGAAAATTNNNINNNGIVNSTVSVASNNNAAMTPPPPSQATATLSHSPSTSQSQSQSPIGSSAQKPIGTLKLPSTAAEMRAILQSKKKYNPKNEEVNLQKKYDIIQKL